MVECKEFSFELNDLEPYFISVAIYDIEKGARVTEEFHFDLMDDVSSHLMGIQKVT